MPKKKIKKIVIGSNNKGKIKEIRDLIPKKYRIFTPSQFKLKSPVENGKSFKENSLIKAKKFSLKTNMASRKTSFTYHIRLNGKRRINRKKYQRRSNRN